MKEILALPASARIFIFVCMMISIYLLLICLSYNYMARVKKLKTVYFASLIVSLTVISITRTPLIWISNYYLVDALNLIVLIPGVFAWLLFAKERKFIYIADILWCILNVTYFSFIPYYAYIVSSSFAYCLLRSILFLFETREMFIKSKGLLAIKDALDTLDDGVLYFDYFLKITYINEAMRKILATFKLSSYTKINDIIQYIKENGKMIKDDVYILSNEVNHYRIFLGSGQISAIDITNLENLVLEEEKTKFTLNDKNKDLNAQLNEVIAYQNEKELMNLKSHIHDNLAQRLSILHMYLFKDDKTDIGKIKQILSEIDMTPHENVGSITDLIDTFASIGINIHLSGIEPKKQEVYSLFYDVIKEGTTNAIKHSFAKDVYVDISENSLSISNKGNPNINIRYGNGLKGIESKVNHLGGYLEVTAKDEFIIDIKI